MLKGVPAPTHAQGPAVHHLDGHDSVAAIEAILTLFPLDRSLDTRLLAPPIGRGWTRLRAAVTRPTSIGSRPTASWLSLRNDRDPAPEISRLSGSHAIDFIALVVMVRRARAPLGEVPSAAGHRSPAEASE